MNSYVGDAPLTHVRHVPGRCLGCAVFANICKDRPGTICNSQWPQPSLAHRSRSRRHSLLPVLVSVMTLRSDCVQVTRISAQVSPGLAWLCTFQLYPTSSQAPAPWRVACAWPELVNVRELGQWQRAKWNDITQVAEYFINPPRPQACLSRRQNNFIELGLFFILYDYTPKLL